MSKKGMIRVHPTDVCTGNLRQKAEGGKITGSESTTRFPQASCLEKPTRSVPEIWGHMNDVKVREKGQEIGFPCSQDRVQRN